jgi:hypothetical protein
MKLEVEIEIDDIVTVVLEKASTGEAVYLLEEIIKEKVDSTRLCEIFMENINLTDFMTFLAENYNEEFKETLEYMEEMNE